MTIVKHTDRSRIEEANRCLRSRWWTYESGAEQRGVVPVRKSIHLVLGGAVHAGLAVLTWKSQKWLNDVTVKVAVHDVLNITHEQALIMLFETSHGQVDGKTVLRQIEDEAVKQALADLAAATTQGVELDLLEQAGTQQLQEIAKQQTSMLQGETLNAAALGMAESVIEISFTEQISDSVFRSSSELLSPADDWALAKAEAPVQPESEMDFSNLSPEMQQALAKDIVLEQGDGLNTYLKEELAALVEAMVRAYARRRLRPLLEQYEVLEVEREGWWRLAKWEDKSQFLGYSSDHPDVELYFMSRHDGLLRDRQTNTLYLLSYKTTGSWDRRKEMEAQIDQQGLTESVDVEKRLAEAWGLIQDVGDMTPMWSVIRELVSEQVESWLAGLPEPPRILGVRYEYLLKGARRQDKKDPELPGRYVADSPLVRAYAQDGITAEDRRWGWTYDWFSLDGKSHRLDYRSWKKRPVWRSMTIAQWIDMLDRGDVQPDSYDESGNALDCLADQFISPILVYRNEDDMRDLLEQIEASETRVAQNAEEVRRAWEQGGEAAERSALNRLFPQSRKCIYPGVCSNYKLCYGAQHLRNDPVASGHYITRQPNHPVELIQIEVTK